MQSPFPWADLWHAHRCGRTQTGETIQDRSPYLELSNLPVEVSCHDALAQQLEATHLGFHQAAPVITTPFFPDGSPQVAGGLQNLVPNMCTQPVLFPRLGVY